MGVVKGVLMTYVGAKEHETTITCPPRASTNDTKMVIGTRPSLYGNYIITNLPLHGATTTGMAK